MSRDDVWNSVAGSPPLALSLILFFLFGILTLAIKTRRRRQMSPTKTYRSRLDGIPFMHHQASVTFFWRANWGFFCGGGGGEVA